MLLFPLGHTIAGNDIQASDVVLCLFLRKEQKADGKWSPSQYVLSESAYAKGVFQERFPDKRVLAVVEEGVDREDLGIAFGDDLLLPGFDRKKLHEFEEALRLYVPTIQRGKRCIFPVEAERLHKRAIVRRDGFVQSQSKYAFVIHDPRFFENSTLRHFIWRVNRPALSENGFRLGCQGHEVFG